MAYNRRVKCIHLYFCRVILHRPIWPHNSGVHILNYEYFCNYCTFIRFRFRLLAKFRKFIYLHLPQICSKIGILYTILCILAWCGFALKSDKERIDGFVSKSKRFGFCHQQTSSAKDINTKLETNF